MVSVDSHLANVPSIIVSCIVLHNICKTHGSHCLDKWTVEEGSHNSGGGTPAIAITPDSTTATARDAIRDELLWHQTLMINKQSNKTVWGEGEINWWSSQIN